MTQKPLNLGLELLVPEGYTEADVIRAVTDSLAVEAPEIAVTAAYQQFGTTSPAARPGPGHNT